MRNAQHQIDDADGKKIRRVKPGVMTDREQISAQRLERNRPNKMKKKAELAKHNKMTQCKIENGQHRGTDINKSSIDRQTSFYFPLPRQKHT